MSGADASPRGGWPAIFSIAAGTFLLVTSEFLPIGLLTPIARDLQTTEGLTGLSVTSPGLTATFAAPLLTLFAGKIDRRVILLSLTASIIASDVIVLMAPDLPTLLIGRVLL